MRALLAAVLLAALLPAAPAAGSHDPSLCLPHERATLVTQATPAGTFYVAQFPERGRSVTGLFQESNGLPGLQVSSFEACEHPADLRRVAACPAIGPGIPGGTVLCVVDIE